MRRFKFCRTNKSTILTTFYKTARAQLQRVHDRFSNEGHVYDGLGYLENGTIIVFQHTNSSLNLVVLCGENYNHIDFEITEHYGPYTDDSWYWPGLYDHMITRWKSMLPCSIIQYGFVEEISNGSI